MFYQNKFIRHRLQFLNSKISSRLEKLHKLKWEKDFYTSNARDLSLEIMHDVEEEHKFHQGNKISLDYNIRNFESVEAKRVSLFVKEERTGALLKEVLIGNVQEDSSKGGLVNFSLPNIFGEKSGYCDLKVGLAVDGIPVLETVTPYTIKVMPFRAATLTTSINLKEAEGSVRGKIEPGEKAYVRLKVVNDSPYDAEDIALKFVNLSGKQISLGDVPAVIDQLRAGETRNIHISIKGSKRLLDSKLPFGVYLESKNLDRPIRRELSLRSVPSLDKKARALK